MARMFDLVGRFTVRNPSFQLSMPNQGAVLQTRSQGYAGWT